MRQDFEALAIGCGPSLRPWIDVGDFPDVPKYGCGFASHVMALDFYCYCDITHAADLPTDETTVIASERVWRDGLLKYDDAFPHAGQAGGMAISESCKKCRRVALVGFDKGLPEPHETELRDLIVWWKKRGRTFVGLMPGQSFDDLMDRIEEAGPS